MGAFHAYDIRGVYNVDFDKNTTYKVGYFIPELLGTDKVLVGRDCRTSSPEVHEYLLKGIIKISDFFLIFCFNFFCFFPDIC